MNVEYLNIAKEKITTIPILVNLVSKRVRQLNAGQRPYVKPDSPLQANLDIALKEIAQDAITYEMIEEESSTIDSLFSL